MKILHVLDRSVPNISGYSIRSNYILQFQKQLGIEVVALTSPNQDSILPEEEIEGIRYYRTNSPKFIKSNAIFKSVFYINRFKAKIKEIIRKEKIDVIHAHSPVLCGLPALTIGRKYNIPVAYEVRAIWEDAAVDQGKTADNSLRYNLSKYYETKVLKRADAVISICDGLKKEMVSRGIGADKIHVVPNGIDEKKFLPLAKNEDLLKKYGLNGDLVFGFIGSLFEFEGLEYFLKAISKVISRQNGIKAVIAGGGRREAELKELASGLHGNGRIIFTGKIPHNVIQQLYSVMDVLVYPRVKNRLTDLVTPIKPLEAMAMAKAVIASDVGGLKELISDGDTGLLFKAGDAEDLSEKMIYLAGNEAKRSELGENAKKAVLRNRNWGAVTKTYLKIYRSLLTERQQ